ncbi:hypothetical protein IPG41_03180 [Candidatus Peregrinibacteria bacterium]|nr:MAG: hypothetical protein IPG41_03180 [Candidatus Peregrinibacteria bacterium]
MKKIFLLLSLSLLILTGCVNSEEQSMKLTEHANPEICQEGIKGSELSDVLPEQITRCFSLGDLTLAFVTQPNAWNALPETRVWESEGNIAWSGLLAKPIKGKWELLYKIPDEDFNPVNLILEGEQLILDAADDSGAGSGEGALQRYVYPVGVADELLKTWQKLKCTGQYIPETYKYEAFLCT